MIAASTATTETPVSDRIAERALDLRERTKLTRAAVVDAMRAAGFARATVASLRNLEDRRRREVGVDELVALAAALDCTPAELLDDAIDLAPGTEPPAPARRAGVSAAVQDDIAALGDLVGVEPSLAEAAYVLAAAIDSPGTEPKTLPALVKELRAVLDDIRNGRTDTGGDDDLADMGTPE
jgi:transcriptional regulator with XRE-family HTH domain